MQEYQNILVQCCITAVHRLSMLQTLTHCCQKLAQQTYQANAHNKRTNQIADSPHQTVHTAHISANQPDTA